MKKSEILIFLLIIGLSCKKKDPAISPTSNNTTQQADPRKQYLKGKIWTSVNYCNLDPCGGNCQTDSTCTPDINSSWTVRNTYKFRQDDSVEVWYKHYTTPNDSSLTFTIPIDSFINNKMNYSAYLYDSIKVQKINSDTLVIWKKDVHGGHSTALNYLRIK
jgi:hypothetical protein